MTKNVFNQDVENEGRYLYNTERLSCQLANNRINKGIHDILDVQGKSFFDIGCGDGITAEILYNFGASAVYGIDPAESAVAAANHRLKEKEERERFFVGNIYDYSSSDKYDVVLFSRVLHHMPDPAKAILAASHLGDSMLIIEPNGSNPIVKLIEKTSSYHIEHGERSFRLSQTNSWLEQAGFTIVKSSYVNLVPMFCPDWMAKICHFFEPLVERVFFLRAICCGQYIISAQKKVQ